MAYLPTVNETKEPLVVGDIIVKSLQKRLDFSELKINSLTKAKETPDTLASKQDTSLSILNRMYQFITKDTYNEQLNDERETREDEEESDENEFIQKTLIEESGNSEESVKEEQKEEKEGIFSKLLRYFKYFSFGRMVFRNWDAVSKLLGLEKLTNAIKGISEEFGVTKILEDIKITINSIMDKFGLGDFKFEVSDIESGAVQVGKLKMPKDPKITKMITETASKFGIDPSSMMAIASAESQFESSATPGTSTAKGIFQITKGTWEGLQAKHPELKGKSVTDPEANILGAGLLMKELKEGGLDISDPNKLYAGMFFGGKGSKKFLSAGETEIASKVLPDAAGSNPDVFYKDYKTKGISQPRTVGEVKQVLHERVGSKVGGYRGLLTAQQPEQPPTVEAPKSTTPSPTKEGWLKTNTGEVNASAFAKTTPVLESPTYEKVQSKEFGEPGEIGGSSIPDTTKSSGVSGMASDSDLKGLNFVRHVHGRDKEILVEQARKLQQLRSTIGQSSLTVICGFRPKEYNDKLHQKNPREVAKDSYHTHGMACDIAIPKGYRAEDIANFVRAASKIGFGGIGVYLGHRFIHVDIGPVRIWHHGLPKVIQQALNDHVAGRKGEQTSRDIPNMERGEPGETSTNMPGTKSSQNQTEEDKRSLLDRALDQINNVDFLKDSMDAYTVQMSVFKKVFDEGSSTKSITKLEELITGIQSDIPRKETLLPDLNTLFAQNNVSINNFSQHTNIHRNFIDSSLDTPSIFSDPFLPHYKD